MSQEVLQTETIEAEIALSVEKKFFTEMEKLEIAKGALVQNKELCLEMKINGQEDAEGYKKVKKTRIEQKNIRLNIKKACEAGREPSIIEQKRWIALEKEWTAEVLEGEKHLQAEQDKYDAEKERIQKEKQESEEKRLLSRTSTLSSFGATYDGSFYKLGDESVSAEVIKGISDEKFEEEVSSKFKAIFEEREEQKRIEKERLEKLEQMQERIWQSRKDILPWLEYRIVRSEVIEMTDAEVAAHKKQYDDKIAAEKEEAEREQRAAERKNNRISELFDSGFTFNGQKYVSYGVGVDLEAVGNISDEEWPDYIIRVKSEAEQAKNEAEAEKQRQLNEKLEKQRKLDLSNSRYKSLINLNNRYQNQDELGEMEEVQFEEILSAAKKKYDDDNAEKIRQQQAEDDRIAEEKAAEELAASNDRQKWNHFLKLVNELSLPEFKSRQYKKMAQVVNAKLNEINSLNANQF